MPTNPYFNEVSFASEQNLVNDLIIEAIQIYGHSAYYLRREDVDISRLFADDPLAKYPNASEIELYLKSNITFGGTSDVFTKFGLNIEDQATFLVSVTRFHKVEPTLDRPRENDIIYIQFTPTNRYLFEIRFVEQKEQLFQLGKLYTYELRCELMNYSHERVQTGNTDIDTVATRGAYTIDLHLGSGNGTYKVAETVYQGVSFIEALATGTVVEWNANTKVLGVQNVTGAFVDDLEVIGVTSNASYLPLEAPDTSPTSHDPISDNERFDVEKPDIVQPRDNPRYR